MAGAEDGEVSFRTRFDQIAWYIHGRRCAPGADDKFTEITHQSSRRSKRLTEMLASADRIFYDS